MTQEALYDNAPIYGDELPGPARTLAQTSPDPVADAGFALSGLSRPSGAARSG